MTPETLLLIAQLATGGDIHTMRFTGSRLWSDPFGCARDVLAELDVEKPTQRPILDVIDDLIGANAIRNAARERDE